MKNQNVITFPISKARKTKTSRLNLSKRLRTTQLERNRLFISGSIVSVLVLMALLNTNVFNKSQLNSNTQASFQSSINGRGIASIQPQSVDRVKYDQEVIQLAKSKINRKTASFGKSPSLKEKLRYEVLEGKYMMQFEKGKIKSIEFTRVKTTDGEPKYVNNREEFLSSHKSLFPVNFDLAQKASVQKSRLMTVEKFHLMNGLKKVANVEFQLDVYGRFISMKVN